LSIGLRFLCHLFLALRFSVTISLVCGGVRLIGSFPGISEGVDLHAASCIRHVIYFTASSISSCCSSLILRLVFASICVRKAFQPVFGDVSLGVFGLWIVWVLSVAIIGV